MDSDFRLGIAERLAVVGIVAGVAGVVLSVAFPLAYPDSSVSIETWRVIFWSSAIVLGLSVLFFIGDMVLHIALRRGVKLGVALTSIATAMIIVGAAIGLYGALLIDNPSPSRQVKSKLPDVTLRFVYADRPALKLINQSEFVAKQIKWTVVLWNLDQPKVYSPGPHAIDAHEPLQIPISMFDFMRPGSSSVQNLLDSPLVLPHIKDGDRLFGSASVVCPDCERGHTFVVDFVLGKGGWFAEVPQQTSGDVLIPHHLNADGIAEYVATILAGVPADARIPIGPS